MTIKELRKQTGLSQSQFAKRFHLNLRTLQTWEQETRPTPEHVNFLIESVLKLENNNGDTMPNSKIQASHDIQKNKNLKLRSYRCLNHNMVFDSFRSEICHMLAYYGDFDFLEIILTNDFIGNFYRKGWQAKAFYTLAILDYLTDKYECEPLSDYDFLRKKRLPAPLFPQGIKILEKIGNTDAKQNAINECKNNPVGKYFYKYNIIERSITDVI